MDEENNKNIELLSKFETIDFETGELVNVLDWSVPVKSRVDSAKYLLDRFNSEIELCKERKKLWNNREDIFKIAIETIRDNIRNSMLREEIEKVSTFENTVYLTSKDIQEFDEDSIKPEYKLYDLTIRNVPYLKLQELFDFTCNNQLSYSLKEKVTPELLPKDLITIKKDVVITFRKSVKMVL